MYLKIKPLSVNNAWQGRRYKTKEYKAYEEEVFYLLPQLQIPTGKLKVSYEFGFSNIRSDWDNPIKPFQDILQKKYGFDDNRIVEAVVKKTKVKKGEEFIDFSITKL